MTAQEVIEKIREEIQRRIDYYSAKKSHRHRIEALERLLPFLDTLVPDLNPNLNPIEYKVVDGGIWVSKDSLQELIDKYDERNYELRKEENYRGASILFGRALALADLLLLIEREEDAK